VARVIELVEAEARLRAAVLALPPETRRILATIVAPSDARAELIGRLYDEAGDRPVAELLIALEEDRTVALVIADVFRDLRN